MATSLRLQARAPVRGCVSVRASSEPAMPRRAVLGFMGAALGGLATLASTQAALAVKIPSQNFTGGLVTGGGNLPKSTSQASMESYSLETGIKHASAISPAKKKALLAEARKKALS